MIDAKKVWGLGPGGDLGRKKIFVLKSKRENQLFFYTVESMVF